jgi:hypothetical protein
LRKSERKFPDRDDCNIHEGRESAVLEFAREIGADPRVGTEQRQVPFRPASLDISKHRQNRDCVIVIPKQEGILPEQDKAKRDGDATGSERAEDFRTREARFGHLWKKTPNAQRRTPNDQKCRDSEFSIRCSALGVRRLRHV